MHSVCAWAIAFTSLSLSIWFTLRYAYAALFLICKISSCIILHTFVKPDCPLINFTFKWPDFPNRISKWLECKIAKHIDIHVEKECTRIKQNKIKCHAICVLCNAKRFFKSVEVFAGFTLDSGICLNHIWHIPMSATNELEVSRNGRSAQFTGNNKILNCCWVLFHTFFSVMHNSIFIPFFCK